MKKNQRKTRKGGSENENKLVQLKFNFDNQSNDKKERWFRTIVSQHMKDTSIINTKQWCISFYGLLYIINQINIDSIPKPGFLNFFSGNKDLTDDWVMACVCFCNKLNCDKMDLNKEIVNETKRLLTGVKIDTIFNYGVETLPLPNTREYNNLIELFKNALPYENPTEAARLINPNTVQPSVIPDQYKPESEVEQPANEQPANEQPANDQENLDIDNSEKLGYENANLTVSEQKEQDQQPAIESSIQGSSIQSGQFAGKKQSVKKRSTNRRALLKNKTNRRQTKKRTRKNVKW
jgi:hypothetical protein